VLEARRRVGGRTLNHPVGDGEIAEAGGQFFGPAATRSQELALEYGVDHFKTYNEGDNVYVRDGTRTLYAANGPLGSVPPDPGTPELAIALQQLDSMARETNIESPWESPRAAEWDSITVESWMEDNVQSDSGRALARTAIDVVRACSIRDMSLLSFLYYAAGMGTPEAPGTVSQLLAVPGGAQERRFVGGPQLISIRMAQELKGHIIRRCPVRRIDQRGRRVRVEGDRATVSAKHVIVAVAPALAGQIDYLPALPADRAQLHHRYPQGSVIKCLAVYDTPFWRDEGLTGQAVGDRAPVLVTFDNSPPGGSPGVLMGFIAASHAREYTSRPPLDRREDVLTSLNAYFGDKAFHPRAYFDMDWSAEAWTRGCYSGFSPPGVLLDYGPALRDPVDRVHWAGAESALAFAGTMEGAVEAGARVARVVGERL
jgi:monoamine oxidase